MVSHGRRAGRQALTARAAVAAVVASALGWLGAVAVAAHPANVAHARITIAETMVEVALSMNLFEVDLVLSLDRDLDGRVDAGELAARRADVAAYLRRTVGVSAGGRELAGELGHLQVGRSADGRAVIEATLTFRTEHPRRDLAVRCEPLSELGGDHTTLARIDAGGRSQEFVFRRGVTYGHAPGVVATALEFLKLGILHIVIGYDHLAFLLGLLLTGASLPAVVKMVTAFTAAHSITLSLAVLDVVRLDPILVEIGIALSIVYVAVDNLSGRTRDGRWLVSFVFGLVHGFGFAVVLQELRLPSSGLVTSLLSFNVGVELAQIALVAVIVPALYGLTRTRLHAPLTRAASAVILSLGLFWLYQRTLS